jgi:hypothetical protein
VDLNQLYFDHQLSTMRAAGMPTAALRQGAAHAASRIAARIGCIQRELKATAAGGWEMLAVPHRSDIGAYPQLFTPPALKATELIAAVTSTKACERSELTAQQQPGTDEPSENPDRGRSDIASVKWGERPPAMIARLAPRS